jgi:TorA maturation chaperone TorD
MDDIIRDKERNILKAYNMLLYFAGTMIMWDPSIECIHDFWNEGILKKLPVSSRNPRFMIAAALLRESIDNDETTIKNMTDDFHSLFTLASGALVPQVESEFRIKNFMPHGTDIPDVLKFYESYGWKSKFKNHFPDDHLGVELLFLTLMTEKYLDFDDYACRYEMGNEIIRFINTHILSWVPLWNEAIQINAKTQSYKGIAALIVACCEDIYSIMEGKTVASKKITAA